MGATSRLAHLKWNPTRLLDADVVLASIRVLRIIFSDKHIEQVHYASVATSRKGKRPIVLWVNAVICSECQVVTLVCMDEVAFFRIDTQRECDDVATLIARRHVLVGACVRVAMAMRHTFDRECRVHCSDVLVVICPHDGSRKGHLSGDLSAAKFVIAHHSSVILAGANVRKRVARNPINHSRTGVLDVPHISRPCEILLQVVCRLTVVF